MAMPLVRPIDGSAGALGGRLLLGFTENGRGCNRVTVIRIVAGQKKGPQGELTAHGSPGDTIVIPERLRSSPVRHRRPAKEAHDRTFRIRCGPRSLRAGAEPSRQPPRFQWIRGHGRRPHLLTIPEVIYKTTWLVGTVFFGIAACPRPSIRSLRRPIFEGQRGLLI